MHCIHCSTSRSVTFTWNGYVSQLVHIHNSSRAASGFNGLPSIAVESMHVRFAAIAWGHDPSMHPPCSSGFLDRKALGETWPRNKLIYSCAKRSRINNWQCWRLVDKLMINSQNTSKYLKQPSIGKVNRHQQEMLRSRANAISTVQTFQPFSNSDK